MKARRFFRIALVCVGVWLATAGALSASLALGGEWDLNSFRNEQTLEFLTVGPAEGEHWSRVWLVVIDGQLCVRLGSRATGRVERNTTAPYVKVRIAGQQFDQVRLDPAPEITERVAAAMAEKYWIDLIVHHVSHPLTARLVAAPAAPSR